MRPSFLLVAVSASLAACRVCKPRPVSSGVVSQPSVEAPVSQAPVETSVETASPAPVEASASAVVSSEPETIVTMTTRKTKPTTAAPVVATSAAPQVEVSSGAPVASSPATSAGSSAPSKAPSSGSGSGFTFVGVNEAGAEFGQANIPGKEGTDYTFPDTSAIDTLFDAGMNTFRVAFLMERMIPDKMTGTINAAYLAGIKKVVDHITGKGAHAVLDPHNFGRYYGNIITDADAFGSFWKTLAAEFADDALVVFDTNNEYHDMDNALIAKLNQAAVDAIRAAGATQQYIFVEGNAYSGAWNWISSGSGEALKDLKDPQDKIVYEMHQYLDQDGSGTSETCVSKTIGSERLKVATEWLKENGKKGILGETAGANNEVCIAAIKDELAYVKENSDVWMGWLWWSAGPWWDTYMFSMEPSTGIAYKNYLSVVKEFL